MSELSPNEVRKLNQSLKSSGLKFCNGCGETKPLNDFAISRGGRAGRCKACGRLGYAKNRESVSADRSRHYQSNREKILAQKAAYRADNSEALRVGAAQRRLGGRDPEKPWPAGASYKAAHQRPLHVWGPAKNYECCVPECENQANEWAYNHQDPNERCERVYDRRRDTYRDCFFSDHHDFYQPMCTGCHSKFDRQVARIRRESSGERREAQEGVA